ncbi:MAG: hypothetical protein AAF566_11135 [Pseudomonadota bacterium]
MTYATLYLQRATRGLPTVSAAHWLIRVPLAAIIFQQGLMKFPLAADDAASFGVPLVLWAFAAIGELACAALLVVGGLLSSWRGDLATRAAGAGIACIVVSVLYVAYWAPITDIFLYNQLHVMLLAAALFFALRGNAETV